MNNHLVNEYSFLNDVFDKRKNHIGETDGTNKTVPKDFL